MIVLPDNIISSEMQHPLLCNLYITRTGFFEAVPDHRIIDRICKDEYVMIYCTGGKGWFKTGEKKQEINKGDIFFCYIDTVHSYGSDEKDPWTIYWVHIGGTYVNDFLNLIRVTPSSSIIHTGDKPKLLTLFSDIVNLLLTGYNLNNLIFAAANLQYILSYLASFYINPGIKTSDNYNIKDIIKYMLENLHSEITLEQLAEYTKFSKYHISKIFKEKVGFSPIDYFIRLKMQKACELLNSTNMKVNEVSRNLGYNDQCYFSRSFKKITGLYPMEFRNSHNNKV